MSKQYEVAIVGGGIAGMSTAFRLAEAGVQTVIIEKSTLGFEASSRNAGGVRHMFRDPKEIPLAKFSIEIWQNLGAELGAEVEYVQNGCVRLAMNAAEVESLKSAYEKDLAGGLPVQLLGPDEILELIPAAPGEILMASYCPEDGHANPTATCQALAEAIHRRGVTIREQTEVTSIRTSRDRFTISMNDDTVIEASKVLLAAGPWTSELLKQFDLDVPLVLRRPEMAETEVLEPFLKPFVGLGDLRGYGRQTLEGRMHMGIRNLDADLHAPESTHELIRNAKGMWSKVFPQLEQAEIVRSWSGFTARTPDECAMLGAVPGINGLFVASGFSGHGFAVGPGTGVALANIIQGKDPGVDISQLGISRFL